MEDLNMENESVLDNDTDSNLTYAFDPYLTIYILVADVCLASFSCINLIVNTSMLCLCIGFIQRGCHTSNESRRPHYGLHFFIFHCILSSVLLECVGSLTNIGYLVAHKNILVDNIESNHTRLSVKKSLDFLTYALFNVSHLNFVLLLNVDKLLYVLRPLHYHQIMNRKRVCVISMVTWLAASAMASPSLMDLETDAQIRQEAILFAMCVVCPASFDLLSAIIIATLVYRIQLRDNHNTGLSITVTHKQPAIRKRLFTRAGASAANVDRKRETKMIDDHQYARVTYCQKLFRHLRVFLRAFTPIIWTCVTTIPYVATMIYLYFGSSDDDEFMRRWTDITMFKILRALGCLYVIYFTGVPLIIVFNNQPYRRRIKILARKFLIKFSIPKGEYPKKYSAVSKADFGTRTSVCGTDARLSICVTEVAAPTVTQELTNVDTGV